MKMESVAHWSLQRYSSFFTRFLGCFLDLKMMFLIKKRPLLVWWRSLNKKWVKHMKTNQIWICVFQHYTFQIVFPFYLKPWWWSFVATVFSGESLQAQSLFLGCCPLCFSVPWPGPFVGRCDCWGQPFSSCPCHRALWGMHFSPQVPSCHTSSDNCSRCIYDNLHSGSILFICAVSSKLPESVRAAAHFTGAYIEVESCERGNGISAASVSAVLFSSFCQCLQLTCWEASDPWLMDELLRGSPSRLVRMPLVCRLGDQRISVPCYATYLTSHYNDWGQMSPCFRAILYSMQIRIL